MHRLAAPALLAALMATAGGAYAQPAEPQPRPDEDARSAGQTGQSPAAAPSRPVDPPRATADFWPRGQLKLGGAIRARYDYTFDYAENISKLSFDTFRFDLNYDSPTLFGSAQYRFYGGAFPYDYTRQVGRINFPVFAWLGYKLDSSNRIVAGLNQIPFGLLPYTTAAFFESMVNAIGLEDVHNFGARYMHQAGPLDLQLGFYPIDGGSWAGKSRDAARYTVNAVHADESLAGGSNNRERNMLVARLAYAIQQTERARSEVGISGLYSTLRNADTDHNGHRSAYAVHYAGRFAALGVRAEAGRQTMSLRNPPAVGNSTITFGAYDGSYNVAAKGNFLSAELSYELPGTLGPISKVTPYVNYSTFLKDRSDFRDSQRLIAGAHFNAGPLFIQAEMRFGRNDPMTGDYSNGAAAGGDNSLKRVFYVNIGYYF